MSTITREFTKEQLISAANARMEFAEMMMTKDLLPLQIRNWAIEAELARIAMASLKADPVAWIVHARTGDQLTADGDYVANAEGILGLHSTPLYMTPQQAPVVADEIAEQAGIDPDIANAYMQGVNDTNQRKLADIIPSAIPEGLTGQIVYLCAFDNMPRHELATRIWNACRDVIVHTELSVRSYCPWCDGEGYVEIDHGFEMGVEQKECRHCRAAMLQGAEPVTTAYKLPEGWVACSERLPEREIDVQVFCSDKKEQMVGYMERNERDGYFRFASLPNGGGVYCQPTHWMPLPAAPQQEDSF